MSRLHTNHIPTKSLEYKSTIILRLDKCIINIQNSIMLKNVLHLGRCSLINILKMSKRLLSAKSMNT